jgi:hypothetical protein
MCRSIGDLQAEQVGGSLVYCLSKPATQLARECTMRLQDSAGEFWGQIPSLVMYMTVSFTTWPGHSVAASFGDTACMCMH